jgi:hypothetical protein
MLFVPPESILIGSFKPRPQPSKEKEWAQTWRGKERGNLNLAPARDANSFVFGRKRTRLCLLSCSERDGVGSHVKEGATCKVIPLPGDSMHNQFGFGSLCCRVLNFSH